MKEKISCIYKIVSQEKPYKIYIGSTNNFMNRKRQHRESLIKGNHFNPKLQSHVSKYGIDDLVFSVVFKCEPIDLVYYEQLYLDTLNPIFNILPMAGTTQGRTYSLEARANMSRAAKGKVLKQETKDKIRIAVLNRDPLVIEKIKKSLIGNKRNQGNKASPETREKMSRAKKGKPKSEETKARMRQAQKKLALEKKQKKNSDEKQGLIQFGS